jgi:hypothetical protein
MTKGMVTSDETAKLLRDRYSPIARDDDEKIMGAIQKLLLIVRSPNVPLRTILDEIGKSIHRLFEFKEIAIGLKSKNDGLFRFEVLIGFNSDAQRAMRKLTYTNDDMLDSKKYPNGIMITKKVEFMPVEIKPFKSGEEIAYNRPSLLAKERSSMEDFIEGDYIILYLSGRKDEVIGWVELSGTRSGKVPSRGAMRWLELIVSILASVICERDASNS